MDISNKQAIVCYIDTNKILFYLGTTGSIIQLEFPPDVLSYLDLLHEAKFEQLLDSFLEQNQLTGGGVILVFATTATFEKDFEETQAGKEDTEIQKFIDIVPFEDVFSKTYKLNKKIKAVAVNNRVYESIKTVLEKRNFLIHSVIPISVLQETFPELAQNIDLGFISSKADSIKQFSIISGSVTNNSLTVEKKPESKEKNKRAYVLGGVFGALLIILIIIIVVNLLQPPAEKPSGVIGTPPPTAPKPVIQETSRNENPPAIMETSSTPSGSTTQPPTP